MVQPRRCLSVDYQQTMESAKSHENFNALISAVLYHLAVHHPRCATRVNAHHTKRDVVTGTHVESRRSA